MDPLGTLMISHEKEGVCPSVCESDISSQIRRLVATAIQAGFS